MVTRSCFRNAIQNSRATCSGELARETSWVWVGSGVALVLRLAPPQAEIPKSRIGVRLCVSHCSMLDLREGRSILCSARSSTNPHDHFHRELIQSLVGEPCLGEFDTIEARAQQLL